MKNDLMIVTRQEKMRNMKSNEKVDSLSDRSEIIADFRLAFQSRQAAVIGRREVLTGKAKFGIFGDGKELAQIAIAHAFQKGDWRSGITATRPGCWPRRC
jgi:hypothetical protein